ncbi:thiamine biosynthesis protein [Candidatus Saccharibacteria bacterium RIFCSPHIGHO2_01_FULL_46_30]|nr:MAG: thiamine biosynthesis protein [Candidatus Saccharibacteria bacterium RIFCSPHIGHO2_01_FULL_46_30]
MKQTKLIMGLPITVEIIDSEQTDLLDDTFIFFQEIDYRYSTYKETSEITQINNGLPAAQWSSEIRHILHLCDETKQQTNGYFDITHNGQIDPSGLVKGWAIWEAAKRLQKSGVKNFYIEAGGDIQTAGVNAEQQPWTVGIRNPRDLNQIIKVLHIKDKGVATSGTYIRGQHIYNPYHPDAALNDVESLTVVGPTIYEADRFATAAFAMGVDGIRFIEQTVGLEGYMVDASGTATFTTGFEEYVHA